MQGSGSVHAAVSCNLRIHGIGLSSVLQKQDGKKGGEASIEWSTVDDPEKSYGKLLCYYLTSNELYSIYDTYGIVVNCPIVMEADNLIPDEKACLSLSTFATAMILVLEGSISSPEDKDSDLRVQSKLTTTSNPVQRARQLEASDLKLKYAYARLRAVCAVQTFRSLQTGPSVFAFVQYYLLMGFSVVLYDRFGLHRKFIQSLLGESGFYYHPYIVRKLTQSQADANKLMQSTENKFGFKHYHYMKVDSMKNVVADEQQASHAEQDDDNKQRTYDYSRIEYAHFESMLLVDTD